MKKITFFIPFVAIFLMAFSCSKSDDDITVSIRDFDTQYKTDRDSITKFLNNYHMTVDPDFNIDFVKKTTSLPSINDEYSSMIKDTLLVYNNKGYKVQFISFQQGSQKRPTQVDSIFVSYRGFDINNIENAEKRQFDGADNPIWLNLQNLISGWSNILPWFKTGTYTSTSPANPPVHSGYGAGVMFLPSGFGYFNNSVRTLGSYSPIIFSFKLYELDYRDPDGDGILSKDERDFKNLPIADRWKVNPLSGYDYDYYTNLPSNSFAFVRFDTDGDGIPNMFDIDDDNDHYTTKYEMKEFASTTNHIDYTTYTFETLPDCGGNITNPLRLKRHLDPSCHGKD